MDTHTPVLQHRKVRDSPLSAPRKTRGPKPSRLERTVPLQPAQHPAPSLARGHLRARGTRSRSCSPASKRPLCRFPKKMTPRKKTLHRAGAAKDGAQRGTALPSSPPGAPPWVAQHSPAVPVRNPSSSRHHPTPHQPRRHGCCRDHASSRVASTSSRAPARPSSPSPDTSLR